MTFTFADTTFYSELLQQSFKEKEAYSAKLKVIAVKAKKELDVTKTQLQSVQEEKNLLQTRISELNSMLLVGCCDADTKKLLVFKVLVAPHVWLRIYSSISRIFLPQNIAQNIRCNSYMNT